MKVYVPYSKDTPATININGHKLVIVSKNSKTLLDGLQSVGGDSVREIPINEGVKEEALALAELATIIKGGVVMAPSSVKLTTMIKSLEKQLPWLH